MYVYADGGDDGGGDGVHTSSERCALASRPTRGAQPVRVRRAAGQIHIICMHTRGRAVATTASARTHLVLDPSLMLMSEHRSTAIYAASMPCESG